MKANERSLPRSIEFSATLLAAAVAAAFTWPGNAGDPWPASSDLPVPVLGHPALEEVLPAGGGEGGFRFAAFGDQRALADGEWQSILGLIAGLSGTPEEPLFLIDTGDVVYNGSYSDQFVMLREILSPVSHIPYLACVGNHETRNNREAAARENTAAFFSSLDRDLSPERMYYRKDVGFARILFLDTNDLVYGDDGRAVEGDPVAAGSRAEAQLQWLAGQFASDDRGEEALTIVVMHHPILQSSNRHLPQARALWNLQFQGRSIPDLLLDGGTDLVLVGHTHTYERFRFERNDGAEAVLVNISGRPRTSFLWFGRSARKAHDIAGEESEWLGKRGWKNLDRFTVTQEHWMGGGGMNQYALFTVDGDGGILLDVRYIDDGGGDEIRSPQVRLR